MNFARFIYGTADHSEVNIILLVFVAALFALIKGVVDLFRQKWRPAQYEAGGVMAVTIFALVTAQLRNGPFQTRPILECSIGLFVVFAVLIIGSIAMFISATAQRTVRAGSRR